MIRAALPLVLLAACGGTAPWTFETYGEPFIEEGIPAAEFEDGCAVAWDQFVVSVADRALVGDDGDPAVEIAGTQVYDLVPPGPHEMATVDAPTGTWRTVRAAIRPDPAATAGNATAAQLAALTDAGAAVLVSGTLTCGAYAGTFTWAFPAGATYDCDPENLVVSAGAQARTQLTVHGDHLFFDSLVAEDAVLRATAYVAADANGDGEITQAELAAAPVAPTGLDRGGDTSVESLWDYLTAQVRQLGHVDGEGHCDVE